jgi:hypothetical protein
VAPGALEGYAARFDDLFGSLAQRRGFREYVAGLLAPRERNKTLIALAGAEPVAGAGYPAVQRLEFFCPWAPSHPARSQSRIISQGPSPDQRRCRLYTVFQTPNGSGRSRHGHAVRVRKNTPSITCR